MTFRHVTNLPCPLTAADMGFLAVLSDYRVGAPVAADPKKVPTAKTVEQLRSAGIVGLYIRPDEMLRPEVQKRTGWAPSKSLFGPKWDGAKL